MAKKKLHSDEETAHLGEFGSAIMHIAEEKGIPKEKVIETIEAALAAAYKKDYGKKGQNIRAEFDEGTGKAKFFLVKEVVDETTREFVESAEIAEDAEKAYKKDKAEKKVESKKAKKFSPYVYEGKALIDPLDPQKMILAVARQAQARASAAPSSPTSIAGVKCSRDIRLTS